MAPPLGRARRALRRLLLVTAAGTGGIIGLALLGVGGTLLFLRSSAGNDFIRDTLLDQAAPAIPAGRLELDALHTDLFTGIDLEGIRLLDATGRPLLAARGLRLHYDLSQIHNKHLIIEEISLLDPTLDLSVLPDGNLDIATLFGPPSTEPEEPPADPNAPWIDVPAWLELHKLHLEGGQLRYRDPSDPAAPQDIALGGLALDAALEVQGRNAAIRDLRLHLAALTGLPVTVPAPITLQGALTYDHSKVNLQPLSLDFGGSRLELSGDITNVESPDPALALTLALPRLTEVDLEALAAQDVLLGDLSLQSTLSGSPSALLLEGDLTTPGGPLHLKAGGDLLAERPTWHAALSTPGLDAHAVSPLVAKPVHLNIELEAQGSGTAPEAMDATFRVRSRDQVVWGEPLPLFTLDGRFQNNVVTLEGLEALHPAGRLSTRASVDLSTERLVLTDLRADAPNLAALSRFGVRGLRGRFGFAGRVEVDTWSTDGRVRAEGDLDLTAFAFEDAAKVDSLSGPLEARFHIPSGALEATGRTTIRGVDTPGADVAALELGWKADMAPGGALEVASTLDLRQLSVGEGALKIDRIQTGAGPFKGGLDSRGKPWAGGDLRMSELLLGTAGYPAEGGSLAFTFREKKGDPDASALTLDFNLDRKGDASFFQGKVQGDLISGQWRIDNLVLAPTDDHPLSATGPVTFVLVEGGAKDVDLHLRSDVGSVDIVGDVIPDQNDGTDLKLGVQGVDLAHIARVFDLFVAPPATGDSPVKGLAGKASVDLALKDTGGAMSTDLGLHLEGIAYPGYAEAFSLESKVQGPITDLSIESKVSGAAGLLVALDGRLPLAWVEGAPQLDCARTGALNLYVAPGGLPRFSKTFPVFEAPDVDLSAAAHVSGAVCDPDLELVAAASAPVGRQGERARVDLWMRRREGHLELDGTVEEGLKRRVAIHGSAETELSALFKGAFGGGEMPSLEPSTFVKAIDLSVAPMDVPLQDLGAFVAVPQGIGGRISGGINIAGAPFKPQVTGGLVWVDGRLGQVDLDQASFVMVPEEGGYLLNGRMGFVGGGSLELAGRLPLTLDLDKGGDQDLGREGLDLQISGDGLPLASLPGLVEDIQEASGTLLLSGKVDGTLANPRPAFNLGIKDGRLATEATGMIYEDIQVDLKLADERLDITRFSLISTPTNTLGSGENRQGNLNLSGFVELPGYAPRQTDLALDATGFWLSATPLAEIRIDAKTTVKGDYPGLKVRGRVEVVEGKISLPDEVFLESSELALDPRLNIVRTEASDEETIHRKKEDDGPSDFDSFDIGLKIDLHKGLRLIANIPTYADAGAAAASLSTASVDLELLSPELKIGVEEGDPSIAGQVELGRGSLGVMGTTFDLTGGSLTFLGKDYTNPQLDITAVRHTGRYGDVGTHISGDVADMAITFQSEDYPDQTDVVSILLFGKPASELADSEGQAGAAMLGSAVAMAAGNSVSKVLGSSVLSGIEFDGEAVRVGVPLSDKTLLALERHANVEEDENVFAVSLEWLITRRMYAEMVTGDRGQSSADVYMRWRF